MQEALRSSNKSQKSLAISQCRRAKRLHANVHFPLGCIKEDVDICKESSPMYTCLEPDLSFSLLVPPKSLPVSLKSLIQRTTLNHHKKILISSQENHPLPPWFLPGFWNFQQFFLIPWAPAKSSLGTLAYAKYNVGEPVPLQPPTPTPKEWVTYKNKPILPVSKHTFPLEMGNLIIT